MSTGYNPIVRRFCEFRAELCRHLDIARQDIRPDVPLDELLPVDKRREVWRQLQQKLRLPSLELAPEQQQRNAFAALTRTLSLALLLRSWLALLLFVPLALALDFLTRHRRVQFPRGLKTLGDMVLCTTSVRDHKDSGYRWTSNEIAMKVRFIVAESLGLSVDEVQRETSLAELDC